MINVFNILQQLHKVIKIGADSKKKPTVETFINNDNQKETNYPSGVNIGKHLRKRIKQLHLMLNTVLYAF